jgi:pimeloyl-ACP methyl ester carboxylesterase
MAFKYNTSGKTQTGRLTYENTEKYIEVNGINIHYHEAGEEHPDTVVFLHGGGLGASGWFNFYLNIEAFSEHFRTILLDMPNFGKSDAYVHKGQSASELDGLVLSEFLRKKGIAKASLMGNSKGGADAIHFSVHHNDQLDLLVLMGARTGPSLFDPLPHEGTHLLGDILQNPTKEQVERVLHLFVYDDEIVTQDFIDFRWASIQASEEHRKARLASGGQGGAAANLTHRLHEVKQPTLVVFGAYDRFAALDSSISLMRHYPDAELHVFRNGGHWVQWELSDEFNGVVLEWAQRQKARASAG